LREAIYDAVHERSSEQAAQGYKQQVMQGRGDVAPDGRMDTLAEWVSLLRQLRQWAQGEILVEVLALLGILFALYWLGRTLRAIVDDLKVQVNDLREQVSDLGEKLERGISDVQEAVEQAAPAPADSESWERIQELWREARTRIELKVEAVSDRVRRQRYNSLSRYTYDGMVKQLQDDNLISADAADALKEMNERVLSLRRSRAATAEDAKQFDQLYARASKELPALRKA
jgi:outer membrane murein-binding lipoprotein Lpp